MTKEKTIEQLEKDNDISVDLVTKQAFNTNIKESNFREKARLSMLESCYLNQGITQC